MTPNWGRIRGEFPSLQNWVFLNTATFGQMPLRAVAAVDRHFQRRTDFACQDFLEWFGDHDELRTKIGRLVNCDASDVAFLPTASSALSVLMNGLDWQNGDEIVTLRDEFPNQVYHASLLADRGVQLREVAYSEIASCLNERTRLILCSTASYVTGLTPPVEELRALAQERGILLALDGTQSVGAMQFDFHRTQPDFLSVDTYKWMLTPNGAGFVLVNEKLRQHLTPQVIGWRSDRNWRAVDRLRHGAPEFAASGEKYEGGMLPSVLLYAMEAVVDMMLEIGPAVIERRVRQLANLVRSTLADLGASVLQEPAAWFQSGIVAARFPAHDASALARALKDRRVLVSARQGFLRVSTHFYNNEEDVSALRSALNEIL